MKTKVLENTLKLIVVFSLIGGLLFFVIPVRAESQVDQSFIMDDSNMGGVIPSGCKYGAQTFTAGVTGTLTGVNIAMAKYGSYSGPMRVAIRASLTGDDLAYQLVPPEDQSGSWKAFLDYMVTFTPGVPVVAGVQYAIVVSYEGGGKGYINGSTSSQYPRGDAWAGECYPGGFWDKYWFGDYFFRTYVSTVLSINIDIKPGSDPNCFNINGHGVIPVAILGSDELDVYDIDPDSLLFGALAVRVRGNKGPLCHIEDTNSDFFPDLVCQFEDDADNWVAGDSTATLIGNLSDGSAIEGTDSICVVPPE